MTSAEAITEARPLSAFQDKDAQFASERDRELLQAIVDRIPVMIAVHEAGGRVLQLNPEFTRVIGWKTGDLPSGALMEAIYPDTADRAKVSEFMNSRRDGWMDVAMRTRDGRTVQSSWANVLLSQGVQVGIGIDISDRVTAEAQREKLKEESFRLGAIVESSQDAIISKDLNGTIVSWNKGAERIFGYTADEVIGKSVTILMPEDRMNEEPSILERIRRGERIEHYETIRRRKDGTLLDISLTVSPIRGETGIIGASKIARDISERRSVEKQRRELVVDSLRLAAIVESSDDAIISKNLDGTIVSWNNAAERLFGYRAEEVIGKSITMLMPPDRVNEEPEIIARIRRGERVDHYETIRQRKDGRLLDISLTISPVKDATGRIIGASKIARDIGERKRMEEQRGLLIAELSHRVKNTLATVISIARQSFANPDAKEARVSFDSRIRGLAQTHSRLAESSWSGVSLETLLADELGPYRREDGKNVHTSGPRVILNARAALTLGMAIHELATNAAKYGALSSKQGMVTVEWQIGSNGGNLEIQWIESGGPPVATPTRSGFGRLLIERALASDLRGEVKLDFAPQGLRCVITVPVAENLSLPA
jgi:two-component system CheB/CheR fusion protein